MDFSEDPINDLHLWLELIIASFLWFRAAAEVDWSATCDHFKTSVDCNFSACRIGSQVDLSITRWECFPGAQSWSIKTSSAFVQPLREVESRSYFGEPWLDPDSERFLYPSFYTVCISNLLFCALKLRKVELVLQCRPTSVMGAIGKIFPGWNRKVTRHWGGLVSDELTRTNSQLMGEGAFRKLLTNKSRLMVEMKQFCDKLRGAKISDSN